MRTKITKMRNYQNYLLKYAYSEVYLIECVYLKHVPKRKVKVWLNLQNFAWQPCLNEIKLHNSTQTACKKKLKGCYLRTYLG